MKRFSLVLALLLAIAVPALAQVQSGSISGTVRDQQGGVLPGALITLQGVDLTQTFTTEANGEYRFLNLAPGPYKVSASLQGFATIVRETVIVAVGKDVDLPVTLPIASVAETITVSGAAPILDLKATGTTTNFTSDELAAIPTSRDLFSLMRTVPGVLIDRVNIGGNENPNQSAVVSKGTRPQDAVWTLDGIVITDMVANGLSPIYFNFDNFEEIQVSTAGQDIKQPTGGVGMNLVVKRGGNQVHGIVRGYFAGESMEAANVPDELRLLGTTPDTADHNKQLSDYGFEIGGPILKDKAWFYGSYSIQDVRLSRRAGSLIDRTQIRNPDVKLNWQATRKDMVSFLYYDGDKIKRYRLPGLATFEAPTATFHQSNAYSDNPFHGLFKIADDRVVSPSLYLSAKYAYFNTGFVLDPEGGLDLQSGRSARLGVTYGSTLQSLNVRPQHVLNADLHSFFRRLQASHDVKFGFGFRRVDGTTGTLYPGNMIVGLDNSLTDQRAQVFRQGLGTNRANYLDFYIGDTMARNRITVDLGLRYDRQWGKALPSAPLPNPAFPAVVPGVQFPGYDAPFRWSNLSPRAGVTYALDEARKTVARASFSRAAGQLVTGVVGYTNPSSTAGSATYRWTDLDGDHFAQASEVLLNQFLTAAGGFNPANPTAVTSSNVIDPDLTAPITTTVVAGVDREIMPDFALQVNYSYTRTTNLLGNLSGNVTPRVGVTLADYAPGPALTGTLPDGSTYNVPTFIPNQAKVTAGGNGFRLTNWDGYSTTYHGLEVSLVKRLSNRWMAHVAIGLNNATEHYESQALYDTNGNPTRTATEPLVDGGQFAPVSAATGAGDTFINARWQVNANAMYQAPYGIEVSANVFGRQGYPFVLIRQASLGADSLSVLVSPLIDTFRLANVWDTDARVSRVFKANRVSVRAILDVFNVLNANTELVRNRNVASPNFRLLSMNLSPRIARVGVVIGF